MTRRLVWLLATGVGSGLFPWIPGTVGSLVALAIYWFLLPDSSSSLSALTVYSIIATATFVLGCWAAGRLEKTRGRDHRSIVIDEFVGQWFALLALPKTLIVAVLGFFLFRLLDILKPFPAGRMESIPGGLGVMADDLTAGIYTNLILWAIIWFGVPLLVR